MRKILLSLLGIFTLFIVTTKTLTAQGLNEKQKAIVAVSALTAQGNLSLLRNEFDVALDAGLTINQLKEVIVHTYAYAGFPRSIRGLQTLMVALEERKARGIKDSLGAIASPINDTDNKYNRGKATLEVLLGGSKNTAPSEYAIFSPVIDVFLKEHLFADIFERDILTYDERELVTIAVLSSIGGVEPMLKSHLNIGLNVGISPQQLQECVIVLKPYIGDDHTGAAQKVVYEVLSKR